MVATFFSYKSCFLKELWYNDITEHNYKSVKTGVKKKLRKQVNKMILYEKVGGIRDERQGWCKKQGNKVVD